MTQVILEKKRAVLHFTHMRDFVLLFRTQFQVFEQQYPMFIQHLDDLLHLLICHLRRIETIDFTSEIVEVFRICRRWEWNRGVSQVTCGSHGGWMGG